MKKILIVLSNYERRSRNTALSFKFKRNNLFNFLKRLVVAKVVNVDEEPTNGVFVVSHKYFSNIKNNLIGIDNNVIITSAYFNDLSKEKINVIYLNPTSLKDFFKAFKDGRLKKREIYIFILFEYITFSLIKNDTMFNENNLSNNVLDMRDTLAKNKVKMDYERKILTQEEKSKGFNTIFKEISETNEWKTFTEKEDEGDEGMIKKVYKKIMKKILYIKN